MTIIKKSVLIILLILFSCNNKNDVKQDFTKLYNTIKKANAPDKRVQLFDISFNFKNDTLILKGETTTKKAISILVDSLTNQHIALLNKVRVLPDTAVGNLQYAVARNSVINIRSNPKHSAELGTQALLGMPLKVLDQNGDFYRVQTPDSYISWVDKGGITRMNKDEIDSWNASKKVIFTKNTGYVYAKSDTKSGIISDIVLGAVLQYLSENKLFYEVRYPDNRTGFVLKSETDILHNWFKKLKNPKINIELIAKRLNGFPYLWGGTSTKGIDCSGFTKMVYLMNGFIIPRDASQQINAGMAVDKNLTFEGLEKGDLLFFGEKATDNKKQRVTHVGIWLGNAKQEFIHASGNVHISSMDASEPHFDAYNKNRYLGSKRYLGVDDKNIIALLKE